MLTRTAVVTGAGSGIGRSVVGRLLKRGFRVIAVGRRLEALQETARAHGSDAGRCIPLSLDVSDKAAVLSAFDHLEAVDVIVANAGVCAQGRLDDPGTDEVWEWVMGTNVNGVWYLFRALASKLRDNGRAVVVSSGLGKLGRSGYGAYTASKHAVLGLVKCFSKELAERQITVNAVCPGWVDTQMAQADLVRTAKVLGTRPDEVKADAQRSIPLGRFVSAAEVAALIDWLTSEDASAVTGQAYNISCGEFFA